MAKHSKTKHSGSKPSEASKKRVDPFAVLGVFLSGLSMVVLLQHAFKVGLAGTLKIVVDYYETLMRVLFGWSEPYIQATLSSLGGLTGIHLHLYPHWKHVFVLLELYFGSHVRSVRAERGINATIYNAVLGISLALLAGIGSGTVAPTDIKSSMLVAAFPVAAVCLYGFATSARAALYFRGKNETWWQAFRVFGRHTIRISIVSLGAVLIGYAVTRLRPTLLPPESGLMLLFVLIIALAAYRISIGAWYANNDRSQGQGWWERFHYTGYGTVGILMLVTLFGAVIFILGNAGLSLLGL